MAGIWRFHPLAYPKLPTTTTQKLSSIAPLATARHNSRQLIRDVSSPLAVSILQAYTFILILRSKTHRPFTSPILFANNPSPLPSSLASISPITDPAHPSIPHLSCALLHPSTPSCSKTFLTYILTAFPPLAKFFTLIFTLLSLPRFKAYLASPIKELNSLAKRILRMTLFITMAIGTSWGSICLFANYLPRKFLPTKRWFFGGFLGGLWAFLERKGGRANFLYSVRLSLDSGWKVGRKRGWWRGVKGGDLAVFVAGLALVNVVFERDRGAVEGEMVRRGVGFLRGEELIGGGGGGMKDGEEGRKER